MNLFELFAKLSLDTSEYEKGLDNAKSGLSKLSGYVKTGVKAFAAIGTSAMGAGAAMLKATGNVAQYGDNIDKMSQKMGISAQAYQEWDAILQHSGTSIDSLNRGLITLQKQATDNADKFEKLGIAQERVAEMSTEELFAETIKGLQNMGESAERTAIASELLGGSAKELGALLNTSAEDTEKMRQEVHALGGVLSDEAVKASAEYQDSLQDMQTAAKGLLRGAVAKALPAVSNAFRSFANFLAGPQGKKLQELLAKIIEAIARAVQRIVPKFIDLIEKSGKKIGIFAAAVAAAMVIIKASTGPVGALSAALGVLAGVVGISALASGSFREQVSKLPQAMRDASSAAESLTSAYNDQREARGNAISQIDAETQATQDLWAELQTLVDKNGRLLDDGYKPRVDYIIGELNNALGSEYEWNGKIIKNYQDMQAEIDNLIAKRKAERLIAQGEQAADEAKAGLGTVQSAITGAKTDLEELMAGRQEWQNYIDAYRQTWGDTATDFWLEYLSPGKTVLARVNEFNEEIAAAQAELDRLYSQEQDYYSDIALLDRAYVLQAEGNFDAIAQLYEDDAANRMRHKVETGKITETELKDLEWSYRTKIDAINRYEQELASGNKDRTQAELDRMKAEATDLLDLWMQGMDQYYDAGEGMISNIVDGIQSGVQSERNRLKTYGRYTRDELVGSLSEGMRETGKNAVDSLVGAIEAGRAGAINAMSRLAAGIVQAAKTTLMIHSPSRVFRDIGKNVDKGLALGLIDEMDYVKGIAEDVADGVIAPFDAPSDSVSGGWQQSGMMESVIGILQDIRDNMGFDVVLQDGAIAGRIDRLIGQSAMRKARGSL